MTVAKRLLPFALLALLAGALLTAWTVRRSAPQAELGVGFIARVACGCRYIGGRSLADCHKDFEPGAEIVRLRDDPAHKAVTAYVPLVASRTVRYLPVLGCQAEPYRGVPVVHPR